MAVLYRVPAWIFWIAACGMTEPAGHDLVITLYDHPDHVAGDTSNADMLLVHDGDGLWAGVTGQAGVYHIHLTSDRYGVAVGCKTGTLATTSFVDIRERTVADGLVLDEPSCYPNSFEAEIDIDVRGIGPGQSAVISVAGNAQVVAKDTTLHLGAVRGPSELLGTLTDAGGRIVKVIRGPSFEAAGVQSQSLDFTTAGFTPVDHGLSLALSPGDRAKLATGLIASSDMYPLQMGAAIGASGAYQIAPGLLHDGELFAVSVQVGDRIASFEGKAPDVGQLELPPGLAVSAPMVEIVPYPRPVFSFPPAPGDLPVEEYSFTASTDDAVANHHASWRVELSTSWLAATRAQDYAIPDLAYAQNFSTRFPLAGHQPIHWELTWIESSAPEPSEGRITRESTVSGDLPATLSPAASGL
ncbi:MAG TPA: hypothetical protein VF516_29540 [Kofleriaceae bacterium]